MPKRPKIKNVMVGAKIEEQVSLALKEDAKQRNVPQSSLINDILKAHYLKVNLLNVNPPVEERVNPNQFSVVGSDLFETTAFSNNLNPLLIGPNTPILYKGQKTNLKAFIRETKISLLKIQNRAKEGMSLAEIMKYYEGEK